MFGLVWSFSSWLVLFYFFPFGWYLFDLFPLGWYLFGLFPLGWYLFDSLSPWLVLICFFSHWLEFALSFFVLFGKCKFFLPLVWSFCSFSATCLAFLSFPCLGTCIVFLPLSFVWYYNHPQGGRLQRRLYGINTVSVPFIYDSL